jgi:hypothetical protein
MEEIMLKRTGLRFFSMLLVLCVFGTVVVPAPAQAENIARTLGGAAGLAAGSMAGAALSSAVIGAAGIASMPAVVPLLISTTIVGASAWGGAKVFSKLGLTLDEKMGSKAVWSMLGATLGTVAAIALIPATGPFAGAAGLALKAIIGGVAGGSIAALFSKQLDTVATPRNLYAAAGGTVGAVIGGIPGALAGAAGGYGAGAILDEAFFADEGDFDDERDRRRHWDQGRQFSHRRRYVDCRDDIEDWTHNRIDRFEERYHQRPERYEDVEDCYYWQNDFYDTNPDRWNDYKGEAGRDREYGTLDAERERPWDGLDSHERLLRAKAAWTEALAKYEEAASEPDVTRKEVQKRLQQVKKTQKRYEQLLRKAQGY